MPITNVFKTGGAGGGDFPDKGTPATGTDLATLEMGRYFLQDINDYVNAPDPSFGITACVIKVISYDNNRIKTLELYDINGDLFMAGSVNDLLLLDWHEIGESGVSLPAGTIYKNSVNYTGENGDIVHKLETDVEIDPANAQKLLALYGTEKIFNFGYNAMLADSNLEPTLYFIPLKNGYGIVKKQIRLTNKDFSEVVDNTLSTQALINILINYKDGYLIFSGTTGLKYSAYDTTLPTTSEVFNSRKDEYNNDNWLRDLIPDGAIRTGSFFKNNEYYGFMIDGGANDRDVFYCDRATFESSPDANNFTLLDVSSLVPNAGVYLYTMNFITYNNKIIRGFFGEKNLYQVDLLTEEVNTLLLNAPVNANRAMVSYDRENTYYLSSDISGCNIYNLETLDLVKRLEGKTALYYGVFEGKEVIFYSKVVNVNIFAENITHYSIDGTEYEFSDILPAGVFPRVFYDLTGSAVYKYNIVAQNQKHALENDELIFAASTEGIIKFDVTTIDTGIIRIKAIPGNGQYANFIKEE